MLLDDFIRHHGRYRRDRYALRFDGSGLTYGELEERVARCSNMLLAKGVSVGDRIAVVTENHPDFATLLFAAARCRAILVPLNYRLSSAELRAIIASAEPRLIFGQPDLLEPLIDDDPKLADRTISIAGVLAGLASFDGELARAQTAWSIIPSRDDAEILLQYTSGTTGAPKGVTSHHRGWIAASLIEPPLKGISQNSNFLGVLPMCHTGGAKWVVEILLTGATLTISKKFNAAKLVQTIEEERITNIALVPTMLYQLLEQADASRRDLSSLAYVNYGGGPMSPERLLEAMRRFGCRFTQGYGMTELAGGSISFASPEDHMLADGSISPKFGSAGRPLVDCDVRLIGDTGGIVADGDVGEVLVRSERVTPRYWGSKSSPVDAEGYYHTGDLGRFDEDGVLTIVDRVKDMIISGGLNIYSKEVEDALLLHDDVAEAYVVGVPDKIWGEAVKAVIVPKAGASLTADDVQAWCRSHLAGYKKPSTVRFATSEDLPRTSLGKVIKRALREQ